MSTLLNEDMLLKVNRPGQYLGNEWGSARKDFDQALVRLCLVFPDLYELGMSNFGLRILYQIINSTQEFMCDRSYAPAFDMQDLMHERNLALWAWESREPLKSFELLGFSLQYELTYTNVLSILELTGLSVRSADRKECFPLIFGGGPSSVNPEPLAIFMDFFIIGDGEKCIIEVMEAVKNFKEELKKAGKSPDDGSADDKRRLLRKLADIDGVYVPALYETSNESPPVKPVEEGVRARILRQTQPLNDANQPTVGLVPYISLVHDRQVLEVRRGCDRGCRFCQPGYTFLPVRERSADDLVRLSQEAIKKSGYEEYSMLSLCVSDYTSLHESVRSLNRIHSAQRTSMSFPSQRADRMNLDIAEELKAVRKSGITLAPEAGTERLRAVINKGLSHEQIISAIESAYKSGWASIKLYYMIGLPTELDEDLDGIINTLKEATDLCRKLKRESPELFRRPIDFTCTISNFVPKPFTPFQWFGQTSPEEFKRKQEYLRTRLRESGLRNVQLNCTEPHISLLEAVISRGDRKTGELIQNVYNRGCIFDAWDEHFKPHIWKEEAEKLGMSLLEEGCQDRPVGSKQPWDVVHVGLVDWWLVKEWEKAIAVKETAPCTENTCHACGVCTELDTVHELAAPKVEVMKKNPFVKALAAHVDSDDDVHPSLFFEKAPATPDPAEHSNLVTCRMRMEFTKTRDFKFISHLDLQHLFIRACRRASIPLGYTEGFNPSPKISIALSLPMFAEGTAELADIELTEKVSADKFMEDLNRQLPPDIRITRAREVEKNAPSLPTYVGQASYSARIRYGSMPPDLVEVQNKIEALFASEEIIIEQPVVDKPGKRNARHKASDAQVKTKNIRPHIYSINISNNINSSAESNKKIENEQFTIDFCIAHGSKMHIKPTDVLKLLSPDSSWQITRTGLLTEDGRDVFVASV